MVYRRLFKNHVVCCTVTVIRLLIYKNDSIGSREKEMADKRKHAHSKNKAPSKTRGRARVLRSMRYTAARRKAKTLTKTALNTLALTPLKTPAPLRDAAVLQNSAVNELLVELAGDEAPQVVREIVKDPRSAEEVARESNMRVSGIRIVLNKLHSQGLAEYTKTKDENSGWYTYVWNIKTDELSKRLMNKDMDSALGSKALIAEDTQIYACKKGCRGRIPFDEAMDCSFRCDNCGASLVQMSSDQA